MRIIGGEFGSRRLKAPKGQDTRPTLDATRESLFNILGARVVNARVLDLFAGSGALGLEAISRGALHAVFADVSAAACRVVEENIQALAVQDKCRVHCLTWHRALNTFRAAGLAFDLVFLDPPYGLDPSPVLDALAGAKLLLPQATILLERDRRVDPIIPATFPLARTRAYADTRVDFFTYQGGQHDHSDIPRQL